MKKYLSTLVAVMLAALSFTLTSCGDDDEKDEPSTNAELVGTWENLTAKEYGALNYIQFKADGTYIEISDEDVIKGNWKRSGNAVSITNTVIPMDATITKLTEKELTLSVFGYEQKYKRVSDSTIDKYL